MTHCRPATALSIALLLAFASVACSPSSESPERLRVTLVGVDGATWTVIDELLEAGELPHLSKLIDSGVRASLRSIRPLLSPPVWTTIATGRTRKHHGIRKFNRREGGLVSSYDRQVPALWTLTNAADLRTAVIGWWATYPAEPIRGVVVSERALKTRDEDVRKMVRGQIAEPSSTLLVHPPEVMRAVADLIRAVPESEEGESELERVPQVMRAEDAAVARSLIRLRESHGPFDLELILLRGVDPVSHYFWKFREPNAPIYRGRRPAAEELARHAGTIESHYRFVDQLLGELGPGSPGHAILLLSDHGFEAGSQKHRGERLSGTHKSDAALDGIFVASGGPFQRGVRLERVSILDVAPTTLHLLGLATPDVLEGDVVSAALDPGWLADHPVRTASGYPKAAFLPDRGKESETRSPADERIERELRALGYIE
jgi:predicted AlkP superfamily phosphohydrolase/phosphomutase